MSRRLFVAGRASQANGYHGVIEAGWDERQPKTRRIAVVCTTNAIATQNLDLGAQANQRTRNRRDLKCAIGFLLDAIDIGKPFGTDSCDRVIP